MFDDLTEKQRNIMKIEVEKNEEKFKEFERIYNTGTKEEQEEAISLYYALAGEIALKMMNEGDGLITPEPDYKYYRDLTDEELEALLISLNQLSVDTGIKLFEE